MKKHKHMRQRQRQKLSRKTIIIICGTSVACMVIGLTVFFNLSHVDQTKATGINIQMISDQDFTNEKSIAAPVIIQREAVNENTIFVKQAKVLTPDSVQISQ